MRWRGIFNSSRSNRALSRLSNRQCRTMAVDRSTCRKSLQGWGLTNEDCIARSHQHSTMRLINKANLSASSCSKIENYQPGIFAILAFPTYTPLSCNIFRAWLQLLEFSEAFFRGRITHGGLVLLCLMRVRFFTQARRSGIHTCFLSSGSAGERCT